MNSYSFSRTPEGRPSRGERHRMTRRSLTISPSISRWFLAVALPVLLVSDPAGAQPAGKEDEPEMTFDEEEAKKPAAEPAPEPEPAAEAEAGAEVSAEAGGEINLGVDTTADAASRKAEAGENKVSWQDIVVVVRKPFLKQHRLE